MYRDQGETVQAMAYFEKSLKIYEELTDKAGIAGALGNIAVAHRQQGNYDTALELLNKCLVMFEEQKDQSRIAATLGNIGSVLMDRGEYASALDFLEKSLKLAESIGDKERIVITLNAIGLVHHTQGNYRLALESLNRSMAMSQEMKDRQAIAILLNNIGRIHRIQGHYDQALEYYQKSLDLSEALGNKYGIALVSHNIGNVYRYQGDYVKALECYQKSLSMREAIRDKSGVASVLNNIGRTYHVQGDYDRALDFVTRSLEMRQALGEQPGIANSLGNLADTYYKRGQYSLSLDAASRAATLAGRIGDTETLWKTRIAEGNAFRALKQPAEARSAFEESITIIEALRANVAGGGEDQQRFFESKVYPYHAMVDLLAGEGRSTDALSFAERARARVLLDVLQTGRINVTKSMTRQEQDQEHKLSAQLVSLNSQISRESARAKPDEERLAQLKAQLQKTRLDFEALQTNLYTNHPELRVQRGEARILRPDELSTLLPESGSALLEYVVMDDKAYLFVITKGANATDIENKIYPLTFNREEIARLTEDFRSQMATRDLSFRASAKKLYELLLKPAEAQLRGKTNLIIVPDSALCELPFQALLTGTNRFLVENASVVYVPSLTVLREMIGRRHHDAEAGSPMLLALGNPRAANEGHAKAPLARREGRSEPLPDAEREVRTLAGLYGASRSKVLIGAEAREDLVKNEAAHARVLHFATHGILNNASPMYSYLSLTPSGLNEDGLLEAWELMQLDLNADLAVLSACETARGRFGAGEGMIGLTWAMFIAGVPSTVVSQWKVESASTRELMVRFHRLSLASNGATRSTKTKAEALKDAALSVMKNPATSHPFYWAGFVLVGDGR